MNNLKIKCICGSSLTYKNKLNVRFSNAPYRYVFKCKSCQSIKLHPNPQLDTLYNDLDYMNFIPFKENLGYFLAFSEVINQNVLGNDLKVLDFGTGSQDIQNF